MSPFRIKSPLIWWLCLGGGCSLLMVIFRGALTLLSDVPFTFGRWDGHFRRGLPNEVHEAITEPTGLGVLFLLILGILVGVGRGLQFPAWNDRYSQWLATTPWTTKDPLPFGPCTPTWRDLCAVVALDLLLWWHIAAFPGLITAVYLYTWVMLNLTLLFVCRERLWLGIAIILALPLWLPVEMGPWFTFTLLCAALAALFMRLRGIPVLLQALYDRETDLLAVSNKDLMGKKDRVGSFRTLSPEPEKPSLHWPYMAAFAIFVSGGISQAGSSQLPWLVSFLFLGIVAFRWTIHLLTKWPIPRFHRYFKVSGLIVFGVFGLSALAPGDLRPLWSTAISLVGVLLLARVEDLRMWQLTGPGKLSFHADSKVHQQV